MLVGRRFERVEILDPRLDAPARAGRGRRRARGRARRRGRAPRQVSDCSVRSGRALLIHLRMTGSLRHARTGRSRDDPHRRAVVRLDDGSDVAYRDVRRFGTWLLLEPDEVDAVPRAARLGAEPLGARFTAKRLGERARGPARAGQGRAPRPADASPGSGTSTSTRRSGARGSIRCARPASSTPTRSRALHEAIRARARAGHRAPGRDAARLRARPTARRGRMQDEFKVYGRGGRAVRPLRHADREDPRRRPRHVVLPGLPAARAAQAASRSSSRPSRSSRQSSV